MIIKKMIKNNRIKIKYLLLKQQLFKRLQMLIKQTYHQFHKNIIMGLRRNKFYRQMLELIRKIILGKMFLQF